MSVKVGQTLWYVPNYGHAGEVTVSRVGRLYFYFQRFGRDVKMVPETMWSAEGMGKCYPSKTDCENEQAIRNKWSALVESLIRTCPPDNMTVEKIAAIQDLIWPKAQVKK